MADKIIFEVVATAKGVKLVQQQTDKLAKSTDNATKSTKKLDKSRDAYNRREKGAASISSNSTKNFSKMQQGIDGGGGSGGLVRAYALLAANVFALTAAFGVLSRSAQIDTLTQSMEILSTTGGSYIKNIAKQMQVASGGAIDLAQAFRQVSLASSAGLNTKEIEGLTMVAKGAAISLGRDLPDAMDRIFRGAIKLEPEILDEIGLFVRVDEAAQKYARQNNKVVSSLSQIEKRQGFLNEILEQGTNKFEAYAETIKPDPYIRLAAALGDISQSALSMVNKAFGPMLEFLAESKTALTVVFGVVVFSLLKLAIPAIGQFNQKLAQSAITAKKNADDYVKGLQTQARAQSEATKEYERDQIARAKAKVLTLSGTTYNRGSAEEKADLKQMRETDNMGEKQTLMQKRINVLMKKRGTLSAKNNALIEEELADLRKEKVVIDSIVKSEKIITKEDTKQLDLGKKSLALRNQEKLDKKAVSTAAVANVTGTAETQGMGAGFKELGKTLRTGTVIDADGATKSLKGLQKGMVGLKGTVGILGVGMQNAMVALGPWMIALAIIGPLMMKFANSLGFGSEKAKALTESLTQLNDANEKLVDRFKSQVSQLKDGKLSFLQTTNATLAYNKGQQEATMNTIKMNKALKDFQDNATQTVKDWEDFKDSLGIGEASKALVAQLSTVQKQIEGAVREGGTDAAKAFFDLPGAENYASAVLNLTMQEENLAKIRKDMTTTDPQEVIIESLREQQRLLMWQKKNTGGFMGVTDSQIASQEKKIAATIKELGLSKEFTDAILAQERAQAQAETQRKNVSGSEQKATEAQEEFGRGIDFQVERLATLKSNLEGAAESIGKFSQTFNIKTKADDLNNSLSGMNESLVDLTKDEKVAFFAKMGDEMDNSFSKIFNPKEIEEFKKGNTSAWDAMVERVKSYQQSVILAKHEQAELARIIKQLSKFQAGGLAVNKARYMAEAKSLKLTATLKRQEHELNIATLKIAEDQIAVGMNIIKNGESQVQVEKDLAEKGLTREQVLKAHNSQLQAGTALEKEQLSFATATHKAKIDTLNAQKATLAAQHSLIEAEQKGFKLAKQVAALNNRGIVKLNPREEAQIAIEAAKKTLEMTIAKAEIEMMIIDAKTALLKAEVAMMTDQQAQAAGINKSEMLANLTAISTAQKATLNQNIENAAMQFQLSLGKAVSDSFKGGITEGIRTGAEALEAKLEEIDTRRAAAVRAAIKKSNEEGGSLSEGISAGVTASKSFDAETDKAKSDAGTQMLREGMTAYAEQLSKLGPEGELVASVVQGAFVISDAFSAMTTTLGKNGSAMEKGAAVAEFAATALSQIGGIMAANSRAQIAEIDGQINAEKKRDGKSKESLAKIKQMEAKKLAMQKKAFEQNKKMQMATTIVSTAASIMQVAADPLLDPASKIAMGILFAAMGAAQLAIISKTKFQGGAGSVEKPKMASLNIGKRDNKVDVSRGASGGEMAYMRGQRGVGSNANDFRPAGGAYGMKSYGYEGEGIIVGEQGPEIVKPTRPVDIVSADGRNSAQNVNFTINTIDSQGVSDFLTTNQGAIISTIRGSANGYGTPFLEEVDTDVVSAGPYTKG